VQFFEQMFERVAQVPGVVAVGGTSVMPFGGSWSTGTFSIEGYTPGPNQPGPWGDIRIVSPDFFKALRVPLKQGRVFTDQDRPGSERVAVVDEVFVQKYFRDQDPIGKRVTFGPAPGDTVPRWITIVGVVGHTAHEGLDADARLQLYLPYRFAGDLPFMSVAVRTTGDPLAMTRAVRAAVQSVDKDMPLFGINTMEDMLDASVGQRKLLMVLLGAFSGIALLLSSIGIYGVMSYSVAQRAREIGIRVALGASRTRVLSLVVGQGMALAALGVGIGLLGALGLTRLLASQLFSVTATDPVTFTLVAALLSSVALLATLLPALRATRVDPVVALREE
jgi:putative ABC transport system permease protein